MLADNEDGRTAMIALGGKEEEEKQDHIHNPVLLLVSLTGMLVLICPALLLPSVGLGYTRYEKLWHPKPEIS